MNEKQIELYENAEKFNKKRIKTIEYNCPICKNKQVVAVIQGTEVIKIDCECKGIRAKMRENLIIEQEEELDKSLMVNGDLMK